MSDLVGNPEYRFSLDVAHMLLGFLQYIAARMHTHKFPTFSNHFIFKSAFRTVIRYVLMKLFIIINKMYLSRVMKKQRFCISEIKDTDQLRSNGEADLRLCFCYIDSTIPLLFKPLAIFCSCTAWFVSDQVGNQNVGFIMMGLI